LLALTCVTTGIFAQPAPFPTKPIRLIVPTPTRTPLDYAARILGRGLAEAWGQPVLPDNRAGGNGVAGQELVAQAQPDGHTLLMQSIAFVTHPLFYKLPYDTDRDFTPVARVAATSLALVVQPSLPATSVKALIALARRTPGSARYASNGNGTPAHLAGEMLRSTARVDLMHAPQRGEPEAIAELMAGHTQLTFIEVVYAAPHAEAGTLRSLATTGRVRSRLMPSVPTLAEAGVPGYEVTLWLGAFAPSGTPAPVVERIAAELSHLVASPGIDARLMAQGYEGAWLPAGEFQRFLRNESQKFAALVRKGTGKTP
jgi:tripartite-type tricarboxylate transporter receptor subunit TctC